MKKICYVITIIVLILMLPDKIVSQQHTYNDLLDMSIEELMQVKINVASKSEENLADAPAIISIITRQEIADLNPRNFTDILNVIPGFNFQINNLGSPLFQFRGVHSVNDQILLMIDGHPVNDRIFSTIVYVLNSIPVEVVEQIEIIRGPGSAMYGANAFYAVINVVTTTNIHKESTNIITKFGSDNTVQGTMIMKRKTNEGKGKLLISGSISNSEGPKLKFLDRGHHRGKSVGFEQRYHLYVNYTNDSFGLKALYNKEILGPYFGVAYYLNDRTLRKYSTIALEATSEFALNDIWKLSNKFYWDTFIYDCFWEYVPSALSPPNGFITEAYARDYRFGAEMNLKARFSDKHRLMIGFANDYLGLTDSYAKNNLPDYGFRYSELPGSWISNGNDNNYAFYTQNNYFITNTLQLVLGIRYDNHTAYGDSWNPRCGITQKVGENSYLKVLYSQAFRAPNHWDLYSNSADQIENPNLRPEKIRSIEAELNYSFSKSLLARINYYHNEISDLILKTHIMVDTIETSIKKNLGKIKVNGIEAEIRGKFLNDKFSFTLNGFYNYSWDEYWDQAMHWVPHYGSVLVVNNRWHKIVNTNLQMRHIGEIEREFGDNRSPISAATTFNLSITLSVKNISVKGSVYNLTDTSVYSPSPFARLPQNYPHPGRTFMFSLEIAN